jgi:FkbM family methyltransferase
MPMLNRITSFTERAAICGACFGRHRGWWIALTEVLPGRKGKPAVIDDDRYGPLTVRLGTVDLNTYVEVISNREYDFGYRDPLVIIDAGAHIGFASVWFAQMFPDATIIAIEMEPDNFELLVANTKRYPNVHPLHAALWSSTGRVAVEDPGIGSWGFRAAEEPAGTVPAVTVSSVMKAFGLDHIDILKVDIEGAELRVFHESAAWIDKVDSVVAELHDHYLPGCSRAFFGALTGFTDERWRGENVFVARPGTSLAGPTAPYSTVASP